MEAVLERLQTEPVAILSAQDLDELLEKGTVLREENTTLSDMIRVIDWQGTLLLQEKTNKMEFIVRRMDSQDNANAFIEQRLETYDRMWDG